MISRDSPRGLLGRHREFETLERLLRTVQSGQSRTLVVRGEAGVGKTALLDLVVDRAPGWRVVRADGVQSEMELPFAGVHQLCGPMLDGLGDLPGPQRAALSEAFGLVESGRAPDNFLVALAVLSLLAGAAEERPLICLIDDAQWLDRASAQALGFVARRLLAERIAMVFAVREPSDDAHLDGLPEMTIEGLADDDARELLGAGLRGPLDERVRDRIIAETRGNPLALLELPRGLTPAELAGGFGLPDTGALSGRIERSFLRRFESLPASSRQVLLTAAAEPVGDVPLLWRALDRLEIAPDAAHAAETSGLVELGARVRFRHPLVRSAIYRAATPAARQEVHRALADATDPEADPDRRAWHRAHATAGLDEEVARELELSAGRAKGRGGLAAAAAFFERAAELSPDGRRGERALAAAEAKLQAGAPEAAEALLSTAGLTSLDELQRARLQMLRAQIAFAVRRGSDAPSLLLEAARRLSSLDAALAREALLEAVTAAMFADSFVDGQDVLDIARATAPRSGRPAPHDLLLDGLATRVADGYPAAVAPLRRALEAFVHADDAESPHERWLWVACRIAADLWDRPTWEALATRGLRRARDAGALGILPMACSYRAGVHVHAGEFQAAWALLDESSGVTEATGSTPLVQAKPIVAAWRGREGEALALIEGGRRVAAATGQGMALSMIGHAHAVLMNGLGRYDEALAAAERGCAHGEHSLYATVLVELVEAAVRCDRPDAAAEGLERLAVRTQASGTDWALGLEARSRALATAGPDAEPLYQEALQRLTRAHVPPYLARAQLVYGEWLRRRNRRLDARGQLRAAHEMFRRVGAEAFAERARRELAATGETVRRPAAETREVLTPQEAQVAQLAQTGHTNPQIGAELFISPRTVEYHLHKVFTKLGIRSRKELRAALSDLDAVTVPA